MGVKGGNGVWGGNVPVLSSVDVDDISVSASDKSPARRGKN